MTKKRAVRFPYRKNPVTIDRILHRFPGSSDTRPVVEDIDNRRIIKTGKRMIPENVEVADIPPEKT